MEHSPQPDEQEEPLSDDPSAPADQNREESSSPSSEPDPLDALTLEVAKWKDQAIRSAAELENYRKRTARDLGEARKYGNRGLLSDLLPILDNFSMGLQAASADESSMIYLGMKMVKDQLDEFLASNGISIVDPTGQLFDPNVHEAISQEESEDHPEGTILRTLRPGYLLHDKLIRAANVVVVAAPAKPEEALETPPSE